MKQLMDRLSNSHWTPDTGMLTYLLSAMAPKRTETTPAQYSAVSRNSPLFSCTWRPTVHANLALTANEAQVWRRSTYRQVLMTSNQANTPALLPAFTLQLLWHLQSGSQRQLLRWPFCFLAKSVKETGSVKSGTSACRTAVRANINLLIWSNKPPCTMARPSCCIEREDLECNFSKLSDGLFTWGFHQTIRCYAWTFSRQRGNSKFPGWKRYSYLAALRAFDRHAHCCSNSTCLLCVTSIRPTHGNTYVHICIVPYMA